MIIYDGNETKLTQIRSNNVLFMHDIRALKSHENNFIATVIILALFSNVIDIIFYILNFTTNACNISIFPFPKSHFVLFCRIEAFTSKAFCFEIAIEFFSYSLIILLNNMCSEISISLFKQFHYLDVSFKRVNYIKSRRVCYL